MRRTKRPPLFDVDQAPDSLGVTYDEMGNPSQDEETAYTKTSDPNIVKRIVPAGTPIPAGVAAVAARVPDAEHDTWYYPTTAAINAGQAQAAIDTVIATGDQIGAAVVKVAEIGAEVTKNIFPILVGIALLFAWSKFGNRVGAGDDE